MANESYLPSPSEKKQYVKSMFDRVASRYDFLNHLLSLGIDIYWRRQALKLINFQMNPRLLDLATGTGDVAVAAVNNGARKVIGVDLSHGMLTYGQEKIRKKDLHHQIFMVCGEAEKLPLPDGCVDAATIAFGIRNVEDIPKSLSEMARVLTGSGIVVILEFSMPRLPVFKQLYKLYFEKILPAVGSLFSSDKKAYHYLPNSVMKFPEREAFKQLLEKAGFENVRYFDMTLGIVTVYCGIKL